MSYATIEAAVLARLRTLTNFNAYNTSAGNYLILNRGTSPVGIYAIVQRGEWRQTESDQNGLRLALVHWEVIIELWQRYKDDASTHAALNDRLQEVKAEFEARRTLGGTPGVVHSRVVGGGEPREAWTGPNGPSFLWCDIRLDVWEEQPITYAE